MLVSSDTSRFAARSPVAWGELDGERLGLLTRDNRNRRISDRHLRKAGAAPDIRVESDTPVVLTARLRRHPNAVAAGRMT